MKYVDERNFFGEWAILSPVLGKESTSIKNISF